jgi:hypothetical protein
MICIISRSRKECQQWQFVSMKHIFLSNRNKPAARSGIAFCCFFSQTACYFPSLPGNCLHGCGLHWIGTHAMALIRLSLLLTLIRLSLQNVKRLHTTKHWGTWNIFKVTSH